MRAHRPQAAANLAAIAVLLAVGAAPLADAQPARLLADVSDRPFDHFGRGLLPGGAAVLDGIAYFAHDDGVAGTELWRSDGTAAGTWRVRDICPGRCWGMVQEITVAGGRLFFAADDGAHGSELWSSDGTAEGTARVTDIAPGLRGARPEWITALGQRVFFSADDGTHGREPWISDGTAAGTRPLGDLRDGPDRSDPSDAVAVGGGILFFADDGVHGHEPWHTDGTAEGTDLVLDIHPGPEHSRGAGQKLLRYPQVVPFAGRAWFGANDGVHGQELWASDGTPAGTRLAADLVAGGGGSWPEALTPSPSRLYFRADEPSIGSELFATDGTMTGLIADLLPGPDSSHPLPVGTLGERLIFLAREDATGAELWTSDGTEAGTRLLVDLAPGPADGATGAWAWPALEVGDQLFFANGPDIFDTELWRTDGTADGTVQVEEIWPGVGSGLSVFFGTFAPPVALGDRLFFFAGHPELGWEPWISDGTEAGTHLVRDIYSTPSSQIPSFFDFDTAFPIDAGGRLYFVGANWDSFAEPWTSRGTPSSTRQVAETVPGDSGLGYVWPVAPLGTRLVLFVRGVHHGELWVTQADGSGAELLSTVEWSGGFGTSFAGRAFFPVEEAPSYRLWVSDGTPAGTGRFVDEPENLLAWVSTFAELDGRLFFLADDALWATDGTTAGTSPVAGPDPAPQITIGDMLIATDDRVFFTARLPETGQELWATDGTEGTIALPEVRPGPDPGFIDRSIRGNPTNFTLVPVPGGVAFVGDDGVLGEEPWWSDGFGVEAIGDLRPGARGSEPRWLTAAGDTLFFAADDGVHGRELWRWRPGEAAALVADLVPGPGSSVPQELAGVDGLLYFSAFTPDAGVELWRSDGTAAGTMRLQDVWPGEESATPSRLTASGRYLFFTADDGTHGREMWSLLLPTRRPRVFLTARGPLVPGGEVVLTLRLENPPPEELRDGEGDELALPLPALLEPLEVTATSGTAAVTVAEGGSATGSARRSAAAAAGGWLVTWNGSLPAGRVVEVVIVARVGAAATDGVSLQAAGAFDSDGDGGNDEAFVSDDPDSPADDDPTFLPFAVEIPALRASGLVLLAAALALLAAARLRCAAA